MTNSNFFQSSLDNSNIFATGVGPVINTKTVFSKKKCKLINTILNKLHEFYSNTNKELDLDYITNTINSIYYELDLIKPDIIICESPWDVQKQQIIIQQFYRNIANKTFDVTVKYDVKFKNFDFTEELTNRLDNLRKRFVDEATHPSFIDDYYHSDFCHKTDSRMFNHPTQSRFFFKFRQQFEKFRTTRKNDMDIEVMHLCNLFLMFLTGDRVGSLLVGLLTSGIHKMFVYEKHVLLLRTPKVVLKDRQNRLHSTDAPALEWTNEREYYFHGQLVPIDIWEKTITGKITWLEVLTIRNIDTRSAVISVIGAEELLKLADAKLIDKSNRSNELYFMEFPDRKGDGVNAVKYDDPSTDRVYVDFVPLKDDNWEYIDTADKAMAWKGTMSIDEYNNLKIES